MCYSISEEYADEIEIIIGMLCEECHKKCRDDINKLFDDYVCQKCKEKIDEFYKEKFISP